MEIQTSLLIAVENFVLVEVHSRFIHEAQKKPEKLMSRVCHQIETLFDKRFLGGSCKFREEGKRILYTLTGQLTKTTWREAMKAKDYGGGGILVIDESGRHFYAESEGFPPQKHYAGDA